MVRKLDFPDVDIHLNCHQHLFGWSCGNMGKNGLEPCQNCVFFLSPTLLNHFTFIYEPDFPSLHQDNKCCNDIILYITYFSGKKKEVGINTSVICISYTMDKLPLYAIVIYIFLFLIINFIFAAFAESNKYEYAIISSLLNLFKNEFSAAVYIQLV